MKQTFYSNGKLLITGEYLVLDGAMAFALPTKLGQNLIIEENSNYLIHWKSYDADGSVWFEDTIQFHEITNYVSTEIESIKNTLITILHEAYLLNPNFVKKENGYSITSRLDFPRKWGLGTSSTLINNLAQWLQIDAYILLNNSFGGSGYDIACAQNNGPILYRLENGKPIAELITFDPKFKANIYFVYLNKKQSSKAAIANYNANKNQDLNSNIFKINKITQEVIQSSTVEEFTHAIEKHESRMSFILETSTAKELLFHDFNGTIKSLGAWGGDFIMAVSDKNPKEYFAKNGYDVMFEYEKFILNH